MKSCNVDIRIQWEVAMLIWEFYEKLECWYKNSIKYCNVDIRILWEVAILVSNSLMHCVSNKFMFISVKLNCLRVLIKFSNKKENAYSWWKVSSFRVF